jgi:hypothetical protein
VAGRQRIVSLESLVDTARRFRSFEGKYMRVAVLLMTVAVVCARCAADDFESPEIERAAKLDDARQIYRNSTGREPTPENVVLSIQVDNSVQAYWALNLAAVDEAIRAQVPEGVITGAAAKAQEPLVKVGCGRVLVLKGADAAARPILSAVLNDPNANTIRRALAAEYLAEAGDLMGYLYLKRIFLDAEPNKLGIVPAVLARFARYNGQRIGNTDEVVDVNSLIALASPAAGQKLAESISWERWHAAWMAKAAPPAVVHSRQPMAASATKPIANGAAGQGRSPYLWPIVGIVVAAIVAGALLVKKAGRPR